MRLWTFHPKYLDAKGLTALWREGLLARKVLIGKTKGYVNHPQLMRFKNKKDPIACIDCYLKTVFEESLKRGYRFNKDKIGADAGCDKIKTTRGQLNYEWAHFIKKIRMRSPAHLHGINKITSPDAHPLFWIVSGPIETWERNKQ